MRVLEQVDVVVGDLGEPLRAFTTDAGVDAVTFSRTQDDWFDQLPGKHRFFFDAATPNGIGDALTQREGKGLREPDRVK